MLSHHLSDSEIDLKQILHQIRMLDVQNHQSMELRKIFNIVVGEVRKNLPSDRNTISRFNAATAQEFGNRAWQPILEQLISDPRCKVEWVDQYQEAQVDVIEKIHTHTLNLVTQPKNISVTDLMAFDRLQTPIWIFDIEKLQVWWANKAALHIWNAQSREELINRNFSDISASTQTRLQSYLPQFRQGKTITENWTFYPQGKPVAVRCLCSGIEIKPGRMAMLVEVTTQVTNQTNQETLRSIEALRQTTSMISLYTMDGVPLMQNPAALQCYGDTLHPNISTQNTFLSHFVDSNIGQQAMAAIKLSQIFSIKAQVFTNEGIRWHEMDIRCTCDPVTGSSVILVNEKDITQQQTDITVCKRSEFALQQQAQKLQLANQQLKNIAMVDQLTQIANRRYFDSKLDYVWRYLLREQNYVSLLLCDIDYFKQYNDTYGHATGDDCLRLVAQAFKQTIKRSTDLVARYGGEEFVVILPNTDSDGAMQVAQEIHRAIQQLHIPHVTSTVKQHVTLSIGIATVIPQPDLVPLDLIEAADQALYLAKAQGRNCSFVKKFS